MQASPPPAAQPASGGARVYLESGVSVSPPAPYYADAVVSHLSLHGPPTPPPAAPPSSLPLSSDLQPSSPSSSSRSSSPGVSSSDPHVRYIPPWYHQMIAGAGAGAVAAVFVSPLDVVRVRIQAAPAAAAPSPTPVPPAPASAPTARPAPSGADRAAGWAASSSSTSAGNAASTAAGPSRIVGPAAPPSTVSVTAAAAGAETRGASGSSTATGAPNTSRGGPYPHPHAHAPAHTAPPMAARPRVPPGPVSVAKDPFGWRTVLALARSEGVPALYRGLSANLLALVPNWVTYFLAYSQMRAYTTPVLAPVIGEPGADIVNAVVSGAATTLVTHPLWLVKARLQVQGMEGAAPPEVGGTGAKTAAEVGSNSAKAGGAMYKGTFDALRKVYRVEGMKALYAGLTPQLFGLSHAAIHFPLYEALKRRLHAYNVATDARYGRLSRRLPPTAPGEPARWRHPEHTIENDVLSSAQVALASTASKTVACVVAYPHEVLRSRFQTQHMFTASATAAAEAAAAEANAAIAAEAEAAAAEASRRRALSGGYAGNVAGLPGFASSDLAKTVAATSEGGGPVPGPLLSGAPSPTRAPGAPVSTPVVVTATAPVTFTSLPQLCRHIYATEGIRGFYRGLSVTLVRSVPACIVTFVSYEKILKALRGWEKGRARAKANAQH